MPERLRPWPLLTCMGLLRAPICYLDDFAHRWFPWTFCGHWGERPDQIWEPFICRLHHRMVDRYSRKRWPQYYIEEASDA